MIKVGRGIIRRLAPLLKENEGRPAAYRAPASARSGITAPCHFSRTRRSGPDTPLPPRLLFAAPAKALCQADN